MKMLKIKRKGFGFEVVLDGKIKIDESKIKPYDQYMQDESDKQIIEQVEKYLVSIIPVAQTSNSGFFTDWQMQMGASMAVHQLAGYLVKNMERDDDEV